MVSYLRPLVLDGKFLSFIKNDIEGAGMNKDGFVSSIKESEINEGQMRAVRVKGKPILLVRQAGEVFALSNRCPHMGGTFEGGILVSSSCAPATNENLTCETENT